MDKPIDQRVRRRAQAIRYSLAGMCLVTAALYLSLRDDSPKVNVSRSKITVEKIKRDIFQDDVALIGTVEPIQTVYLDATEGGRVEEIFIREGTRVKKGDEIIRISNDNLVLEISNYETEVARAINDLRSMRVNLENQQHINEAQLVEYTYDLCKLERDVANNEQLIQKNIITRDAYSLCKENYERRKKLHELLRKKSASDAVTFAARISSGEEMVESMQKNLEVNRKRLNLLRVRAPVDGELATLVPELGQVVHYGARMGTINILDAYKVKAEVDEHYIARVRPKLKASCEFQDREFSAEVSKVYPEVSAGKFAVDLVFSDKVPEGIRIGQTTRIRLELGESQKALLIPRGGFFPSTGGQWIFVVDQAADVAVRRSIKIGLQNPDFYEVLEGLEAGEDVITSGYESFNGIEKIVLKEGGAGTVHFKNQ
jgi:HlyD family secretion protein